MSANIIGYTVYTIVYIIIYGIHRVPDGNCSYSVSHRAGSSILAEVDILALIHIFLTCGTSVVLSTFAQERAICVL